MSKLPPGKVTVFFVVFVVVTVVEVVGFVKEGKICIHNNWPGCRLLQFICGFIDANWFKVKPNFVIIDQHESVIPA